MKTHLGHVTADDGTTFALVLSGPSGGPGAAIPTEAKFRELVNFADAWSDGDKPFRYFKPAEVGGLKTRSYKSWEFVVPLDVASGVAYWSDYFNGSGSVMAHKPTGDGLVAFYCEYTAW